MPRYDCVILYNAPSFSQPEGSCEQPYPSTIVREEIGAIEEVLRDAGFGPYVMSVDNFSRELVQALFRLSPRFVFNLCEEINGRTELEMCVAGLLDMMGLPYTGSEPFALGLALNKFHVKRLLRSAKVPSPKGYTLGFGQRAKASAARFPVIVKPVHEDASLGINSSSICHDEAHLLAQADYIHSVYRQDALVEEYMDGRELNVSVIGDGEPRVLAISEIDFSGLPEGEPHIVGYRAKWDEESVYFKATKPICPADLPKRFEDRVKEIAIRAYRAVGCRDYGRVDLRTDARGNLYVLEVNPNPDIAPGAGYARAARAAGLSYSELILQISQFAIERGAKVASAAYAL